MYRMKKVIHNKIKVISRMLVFIVAGGSVLAQASESFDYPLGFGISASPSMEISTRHDDNVFLQDDRAPRVRGQSLVKSSWITELAPSIKLVANDGPNQYSAQYTLTAGRYHSSRDDDFVDHELVLQTHNEFNYRNQLNLEFDYLHLHEKRGTGIVEDIVGVIQNRVKTPLEYDDVYVSADYTYGGAESKGRITVKASHLDREYTNYRDISRFYDRDEGTLGATFYYRVMPKTSLLFDTGFKNLNYDKKPTGIDKLDGDEQRYEVGVTWEATEKTTGTAQIGKTYKDFDASNRKDRDFTSWAVSIEWAPLTYSIIDLSSSRHPVETNGTGSFIENTDYIVASWRHAWSEKLSSRVRGRLTNQDYIDSVANREDDIKTFGIGADYQFRHGVAFALDYDYSNRDSNAIYKDYEDNVIMFSVELGM